MPIFLVYTFREPELLGRVASRLHPARMVVHVDAKVDIAPFQNAVASAGAGHRVTFVVDRVLVSWAGWSQVVAIKSMVKAALEFANPEQYLILLSGQDYPIKPIEEITSFLRKNSGTQFMRCFDIRTSNRVYQRHGRPIFARDLPFLRTSTQSLILRKARTGVIRLIEYGRALTVSRQPPAGLVLAHGPTHFAAQAHCLAALEERTNPEIDDYLSRVFCPEEKYFQSLLASSPFRHSLPDGNLVPFCGEGNWRYANLHHIHPSLIKVYDDHDIPEVSASSQFFLRKLESQRSARLLDYIDRRLLRAPMIHEDELC